MNEENEKNIEEIRAELKEGRHIEYVLDSLPLKDKIEIFENLAKLLRMIANSTMKAVRRWKKEGLL